MGYGLVAGEQLSKPRFIACGSIGLMVGGGHFERLDLIYSSVAALVDEFHPTEVAIEAPFFGKNAQSMLKLGRAQGVAIAAAISKGLQVEEYAPLKVKMAVTGNGDASKEQVQGLLAKQFPGVQLDSLRHFDATDALAVALCHYYQGHYYQAVGGRPKPGQASSWASFVEQHPDRVK
ncbi:MAG: crossover junction endodeoxyribonuclease RuvC [Bacteroidia bacterium]|nr:MAG: crossover junction endodeoxyribonuclease RuvC [Bacteroidia bacterium]